eukprot:COSAG05_NODE_662_length_8034_cov_10.368998_4_plen_37_part_00
MIQAYRKRLVNDGNKAEQIKVRTPLRVPTESSQYTA